MIHSLNRILFIHIARMSILKTKFKNKHGIRANFKYTNTLQMLERFFHRFGYNKRVLLSLLIMRLKMTFEYNIF